MQIKRIHEYKRQLLNVLHIVTRYNRIREGRTERMVPRTVIFGGKAAPGYVIAKLIIKLIHSVGDVVNHDPRVGDLLKVVFIPDYNVSNAERIIPACDLSEQISTAGTEASGTGNMKLALNGALTIGTLDGANIEIKEEVGDDNIFIFGLNAAEVQAVRAKGLSPGGLLQHQPRAEAGPGHDRGRLFLARRATSFPAHCRVPDRPRIISCCSSIIRPISPARTASMRCIAMLEEWTRRSILNVARMGRFSSDRSVREYAEKIWKVKPVKH